jgi:hypothetical protein
MRTGYSVHPCGTGRCGSIGISPPPEFDKAVIWMSVDGNIGNRISYIRLARLDGLRERVKKFAALCISTPYPFHHQA